MKSMRMALLAAAAFAVVPGAAYADAQDRPDRDNHGGGQANGGDHGNHGNNGGGDHARPAPPQGPRGAGMMVAPGSTPNGYHPVAPQMPERAQPQSIPQAPRDDRGGWQGGGRGPGSQGRGDVRIDRSIPSPNADTGQARAQWRQGDRGNGQNDGRFNDDRRGDNRGQWNNGNRPDNDHRWDANGRGPGGNNDHRWDGNGRGPGNDNDHRWDNGRGPNNNDHRWDGRPNPGGRDTKRWNGRPGNDHRWDTNRWRNDRRYDWRDWRSSHRSVFSRHYYAPRGYNYRSVYAGFFLQPLFYGSSYWLNDPYDDYRLPPAEWPLRWVHYFNYALLVDTTSGEVVDVIPNFFY